MGDAASSSRSAVDAQASLGASESAQAIAAEAMIVAHRAIKVEALLPRVKIRAAAL
jgi:hypothetical protein